MSVIELQSPVEEEKPVVEEVKPVPVLEVKIEKEEDDGIKDAWDMSDEEETVATAAAAEDDKTTEQGEG